MASKLQSLWQGLLLAKNNSEAARPPPPYWLLLETSQDFRLRQDQYASVPAAEQAAVYQRAGLRTPAENAARDWQAGPLWLQHVAEALLEQPACRLVWLQTGSNHAARRRWLQTKMEKRADQLSVVDCCGSDPFGWDEENIGVANLERLDLLLDKIKKQHPQHDLAGARASETLSIVVESLTPLLVRHGLVRTIHFLTKVSDDLRPAVLVLPVLVETMSTRQIQKLEDISQAILLVRDGEAEMLRQGVREKGNRVREKLPFRIVGGGDTASIKLLDGEQSAGAEQETNKSAEEGTNAVSSLSISSENKTTKRSGKVQLQVDEGIRQQTAVTETPTSSGTQPRIFMQDDDPEFEDYDEEDPDDDLDL